MRWAMAALTILRSRSDAPAKKSARRYAARSMVRTTCASLSWPACDLEKEDSTELCDDEKKGRVAGPCPGGNGQEGRVDSADVAELPRQFGQAPSHAWLRVDHDEVKVTPPSNLMANLGDALREVTAGRPNVQGDCSLSRLRRQPPQVREEGVAHSPRPVVWPRVRIRTAAGQDASCVGSKLLERAACCLSQVPCTRGCRT
jgi:hypothetical protein